MLSLRNLLVQICPVFGHFISGANLSREVKKKGGPYSTRDSLVVPYQSTDLAQRCLTSQFGWDAVLSPWYDRMTMPMEESSTRE